MKAGKWIVPLVVLACCTVGMLCIAVGCSGVGRERARLERNATMTFLLPGSENFVEVVYRDEIIQAVWQGETGYVVETVTDGYVGSICLLVGIRADGQVTGVTIRDLTETRGLGANALRDPAFLAQFLGTDGGAPLDAMTGATVTSKAIAAGVRAAVGYVTGADASSGATTWGG